VGWPRLQVIRIPRALLIHTVQVSPLTGRGRSGPVYGPTFTITRCYVDEQVARILDMQGNERTSDSRIYVNGRVNVPPGSLVTYRNQTHEVMANNIADSPFGTITTIELGGSGVNRQA
jgi:hypothetical protein